MDSAVTINIATIIKKREEKKQGKFATAFYFVDIYTFLIILYSYSCYLLDFV